MDESQADQGPEPGWQQPLDELERIFQDASRALAALRRALEEPESQVDVDAPVEGKAAFERLWQRLDREKTALGDEPSPELKQRLQGLDLLPKHCLVTIEDRERPIDLVPVQRALLSLAKQEDIELVSFVNGTPVISMRTEGALDPDKLGELVKGALGQDVEVIPQSEERIFVRVGEAEEQGAAS